MDFFDIIMDKWERFMRKARPVFRDVGKVFATIGNILLRIWNYLLKFRKIVFAVPVGWGAFMLAVKNMQELPDIVGLVLQTDGEFMYYIAKELAVLGPIAITALCLLLMFCSKRVLTPWLVSVVSLAVPLAILVTNIFPA
jgi:hypothetical protein